MQRFAKHLLIMLIGSAIFVTCTSTASCHHFIHDNHCASIIFKHKDQDHDFWDKFRESVQPREDNPTEKPPKEKPPKEKPPKESGDRH